MKKESVPGVYEILKEWAVQQYEVIDKKALQEITLGAFILATGGGGDPDDLEHEIKRIYVAERTGRLTRTSCQAIGSGNRDWGRCAIEKVTF